MLQTRKMEDLARAQGHLPTVHSLQRLRTDPAFLRRFWYTAPGIGFVLVGLFLQVPSLHFLPHLSRRLRCGTLQVAWSWWTKAVVALAVGLPLYKLAMFFRGRETLGCGPISIYLATKVLHTLFELLSLGRNRVPIALT